ncbi:MAG: NUDIX domain-containing protein [Chloroflexota bacterium]
MPYFYRNPNAPRPNCPRSPGAVALIERDDALLMDLRGDGRWGLVGGAVNDDESVPAALCREVLEETGLVVTSYRLFGIFSDPSRIIQYESGDIVPILSHVFWAEVAPFEQLQVSHESRDIQFVPRAALADLDIVETHRHIVDCYLAGEGRDTVILE